MQFEVGSILEGKVTGITKFGAFVELPGGKTGMVHILSLIHIFPNVYLEGRVKSINGIYRKVFIQGVQFLALFTELYLLIDQRQNDIGGKGENRNAQKNATALVFFDDLHSSPGLSFSISAPFSAWE